MNTDPEENTMNEPMTIGGHVMAPLQFDPDEYRADIAEFELTEAQENELLQTLFEMMATMVDIGFGMDSVQMFLSHLFEEAGADSGKLVKQNSTPNSFNQAAIIDGEKQES